MATKITEGAPVRIADRESNASDLKSGLFYPYYRGLIGTVAKLYVDGTANVQIDPASLPEEIRKRHQAGTDALRQKWLDGLSDEARNKLSAAEKKFSLRYSLLVAVTDLLPADAPVSAAAPAQAVLAQTNQEMEDAANVAEAARKSSADLDDAEARHLAEVARARKAM